MIINWRTAVTAADADAETKLANEASDLARGRGAVDGPSAKLTASDAVAHTTGYAFRSATRAGQAEERRGCDELVDSSDPAVDAGVDERSTAETCASARRCCRAGPPASPS